MKKQLLNNLSDWEKWEKENRKLNENGLRFVPESFPCIIIIYSHWVEFVYSKDFETPLIPFGKIKNGEKFIYNGDAWQKFTRFTAFLTRMPTRKGMFCFRLADKVKKIS